jgi:hypothetical protein
MCDHETANITRRVITDRTFPAKGKPTDASARFDDSWLFWHCPACGQRGNDQPDSPGLPRWISERLAAIDRSL